MSERPMIQVDLRQNGKLRTLWVDKSPKLKEHALITLKDIEGMWYVTKIYDKILDIEQLNSQRNFDNNNYDIHKGLFT